MTTTQKVWTENYLEMSHGKTRYWEAGTGCRPSCCTVRAGTRAARTGPWPWARCPSTCGCWPWTVLNWGTGDVLDQEFSFAYLVDHVREFMDGLGIAQANVVGHSMGGWILTLLCYESPNRVRKASMCRRRSGGAAAADDGRIQGAGARADSPALYSGWPTRAAARSTSTSSPRRSFASATCRVTRRRLPKSCAT